MPCYFQEVCTVTVEVQGSLDKASLDNFLQNLLWEKDVQNAVGKAMEIFRLKGVVSLAAIPNRVVIQAVQELYDSTQTTPWLENEDRFNRIVFIGKYLDSKVLTEQINKCHSTEKGS
ncbi:hypothetical protein ScPMuIL_005574 [Solemya velum]